MKVNFGGIMRALLELIKLYLDGSGDDIFIVKSKHGLNIREYPYGPVIKTTNPYVRVSLIFDGRSGWSKITYVWMSENHIDTRRCDGYVSNKYLIGKKKLSKEKWW